MFALPFIIFGVFFVVFLMIGISAFKTHKKTGETMQNMINTVSAYAEKELQKTFEQPKPQTKTCEYCGSTISEGSNKCEACGAKVKK